ncbi:inositol monophosphatase family protein [Nitrospira moscoviensis]|uniref:Putative Inositol-phosphate phosphatase n=1 Tax=Nitrospira moscoviensis TaxID=42253 RepID=A0A0K2GJQ6_NITMO|nr:3'(2'),5'-bisphosphate nucleotidase CysQ [Nitrospira moscoviensis]ALA61188.1 putative Inositol-phosphate phosphatase [Nitrospira moscoviensis]
MSWERELHTLKDAIRNAGVEAARLSAEGFDIRTKADESPVTSADLAVNAILHERLLSAFPEDGWLSEESPDSAARLDKRRVWIIDPIDGTKAFIRKEPEYCVSVALVEEGRPIVAAIYNPSTDELFTAVRGGGLRLNDEPIHANGRPADARPVIAVSPWEQHLGRFKTIEPHAASRPMRSIAWALALLAGGRLHAVATFEPENEWDVAAGALLIEEAGGTLQDGAWHTLGFNRPEPRYRGIIAVSRHCPPSVARQLRALSPA